MSALNYNLINDISNFFAETEFKTEKTEKVIIIFRNSYCELISFCGLEIL